MPVSSGYADQPHFLRADDGALVLICTTGKGHEGTPGQHVVTARSEDDGATWSSPVELEPPDGVESSYAVLCKTPSGRIYAFYNHNTDNVRKSPADPESYPDGWCRRVDQLGHFVFRYSDDCGKSWSNKRHVIPVREFEIDRGNPHHGEVRHFWNVGKPFQRGPCVYVSLHKIGALGINVFSRTEGVFVCSDNLLTEPDPGKIRWTTLPDGEIGLRAPEGGGPIAEEQSTVVLSDGTLFCIYRTVAGSPAFSVSRDGGHNWSRPDYLAYPDGRRVKNPRAANFIWKLSGGRYLYWFHNHGEKSYAHRNIVWCLGATEVDTPEGKSLSFTQPEVLFYNDCIIQGMSYPDLLELDSGDLLITETEKKTARMHRIPAGFVSRLFAPSEPEPASVLFAWDAATQAPGIFPLPELPVIFDHEPWPDWERTPNKDWRRGMSIELQIRPGARPGVLVHNRTEAGRGFAVELTGEGKVGIRLEDPYSASCWTSSQTVHPETGAHLVIVIDGGPKIVSMIFDGSFDDGGPVRPFGFGRFHPALQSVNGGDLRIDEGVQYCRLYARALMTGEAIILGRSMERLRVA